MTRWRPADLERRAAWWTASSHRKLSRDLLAGSCGFFSYSGPESRRLDRLGSTTDGSRGGLLAPAKHGDAIGGVGSTLSRSRTKCRRRSCASPIVVRSLTDTARVGPRLSTFQWIHHRWNSGGTSLVPRSQRPGQASPSPSIVPATMDDVRTLLRGGRPTNVSGKVTIGAPCSLGAATRRLLKKEATSG